MKKVNGLLILMYVNTLLLFFVCLYLFGKSELVTRVDGKEIESFDTLDRLYEYLPIMFWVWFIIFCIVAIINIISILIDCKKRNTEVLFKKMKRVKIGLIPFWIINFIYYTLISFVLLLVGHGFGFFIVPLFIFASYMVLLLSSLFSIAYLFNLKRSSIISVKQLFIHTILQLFFIIDIVDTIYIVRKFGKS